MEGLFVLLYLSPISLIASASGQHSCVVFIWYECLLNFVECNHQMNREHIYLSFDPCECYALWYSRRTADEEEKIGSLPVGRS